MNIVLLAIGKRGYTFAAYNLAFSIKHHSPDAKILLIHDGQYLNQVPTDVFDELHEVNLAFTHQRGVFDAGGAKLGVYSVATKYFKEYLYLDVDALCLKDLTPFYESLTKDLHTDIMGKGGFEDKINYSIWASNEDIWEQFELEEDSIYYAPQTSWHYAKKTRANTYLFKLAQKLNIETFKDAKKLSMRWGKALPDELIFGGALAVKEIDASTETRPIFFGSTHKSIGDVKREYYILSLYGNGNGRTLTKTDYIEFYDREMIKILRQHGKNHHFKVNLIMNDKLVNK